MYHVLFIVYSLWLYFDFFSFFFFKQKTAYEMRISDWSSDVCSSDLPDQPVDADPEELGAVRFPQLALAALGVDVGDRRTGAALAGLAEAHDLLHGIERRVAEIDDRSEEHTSELQSLMRISYAVFCLTKKTKNTDMSIT